MNSFNIEERIDSLINDILILEDDIKNVEKKAKTEMSENKY